jgi:hypothetical protein
MPRYEQDGEWIEVAGTRKMPMSAFHDLYGNVTKCVPIMRRLLKDHNLVDWDGVSVDFARTRREVEITEDADGDKQEIIRVISDANVSPDQLDFIRASILDAIRAEAIVPEA